MIPVALAAHYLAAGAAAAVGYRLGNGGMDAVARAGRGACRSLEELAADAARRRVARRRLAEADELELDEVGL